MTFPHRLGIGFVRVGAVLPIATAGLVGLGPASAYACSCAPDPPPAERLENADAVFAGRLVDRSGRFELFSWPEAAVLTFDVTEVYKGEVSQRQEIVTPASGASCGLEIEGPGPYVIFAAAGGDFKPVPDEGQYRAILCGGADEVSPALEQDLVALAAPTAPIGAIEESGGAFWGWPLGGAVLLIAGGAAVLWRRRR